MRRTRAFQRDDAGQDVDLVKQVALVQRLQPLQEAVVVEDRLGLHELRAGVDLLVHADRLVLGRRTEGRGGCAQEPLRPRLDLAAVQVDALVAHSAQYPQHLHGVQVKLIRLGHRSNPGAVMVAAEAEEVVDAQPGRAHGLRSDGYTGPIARLELHHRLQPLLQ